MKSLEAQFVEIKAALLDGKKCVEADLKKFTEAPTMEQRLSGLKKYAAEKGITESSIEREAATSKVIAKAMKDGLTEAECVKAVALLGITDISEAEIRKMCRAAGVTESKKVVRNNGRGSVEISESDKKSQRVQQYMKKARCSFREASIALFGTDPGKDAKVPDTVIAERAAKWRKYAPTITEQEATILALKGIEP